MTFPKGWSNQTDQGKVIDWVATNQALRLFPCSYRCQQLSWWSCVRGSVCVWLPASDRQCLQRPLQRECGSEHRPVCALWEWLLLPGEVLEVQRELGSGLPHKALLPLCSENTVPVPSSCPLPSYQPARSLLLRDQPPASATTLEVPSAAS